MLLSWFDAKEVDAFSDSIAADLIQRFPVSEIEDPKRKGPARLKKVHDAMFARADVFARTQSLNIYKRARLGNRLKWTLSEAGYPKDFVDTLVYELVRYVTIKGVAKGGVPASKAPKP